MNNAKTTLATLVIAGFVGLGAAGCAVTRDQSTVGEYIDDSTITTRVKAKFAEDREVSAMAISVETLRGVVQHSGFAKTAGERSKAENLARNTSGVNSGQDSGTNTSSA